ncbi:MAG: HAD family hydrolase [Lachnospiraceae bacterium]|nr:HAD family hydrolase [Lachnospiraceae bacterium]
MNRSFDDYSLYVFDLDGTLYDQPRLRFIMASRLIRYYALHPFRIRELLLLSKFRKVKDSWTQSSSEDDIIKEVAAGSKADPDLVSAVVKRWIYDDPLSALVSAADKKLAAVIEKLRAKGKKVFILSDYPAKDKLAALGVTVDKAYDPDDARIDALKPSPKGLMVIMEDTGIPASEILMIGDRPEKDGECAKAAGVDSLILQRRINRRCFDEIQD